VSIINCPCEDCGQRIPVYVAFDPIEPDGTLRMHVRESDYERGRVEHIAQVS